jgi:flagellum-specific ATP synthase
MSDEDYGGLAVYAQRLRRADPYRLNGRVAEVIGLVIESLGPEAEVGEICLIGDPRRARLRAEVVGFRDGRTLLMPLGELHGIRPGDEVVATGRSLEVPVGTSLLGRVVDGLGVPIDGGETLEGGGRHVDRRVIVAEPPSPLQRAPITERMAFGVRALDTIIPCGKGQRLGIFAGSGVGKSTLLGMIARNTEADVNVIALVGERGREVREFVERDLGPEGMARSVVVVATSDQPALLRAKCAETAMTIAEAFRDQGRDVLLLMDSVTRFAMAQREIGLAVGEPPASRGYTPSVFAVLPRLLERAGTGVQGSITSLITVLVEGDDMNDPVADAVRGILDGHVVLDRRLAHRNHYPAIDVLQSVSRLASAIQSPDARAAAGRLREVLATYRAKEDLIAIGAYAPGSDPKVDYAIQHVDALESFLRQPPDQPEQPEIAERRLMTMLETSHGAFASAEG